MHPVNLNFPYPVYANRRNQSGVSLIEVLISLLLFGVSVMGYSALQTRSMQESLDSQQRAIALWRANGLIDRISANNSDEAISQYASAIGDFDECSESPPANCAEIGGSADACSAEDLADYDVWSAFCGVDGGSSSQLIDFSVGLACDAACASGVDMTVTVNWVSKAAESNSNLNADAAVEQIALRFRP